MRSILKHFQRDERGGIMVMFGFTAALLVVAGGMAIDLGRQQVVQQLIQYAADAATSSGASIKATGNVPARQAQHAAAAQRYFRLNFSPDTASAWNLPSYPTPTITFPLRYYIKVEVDSIVPTSLVSVAGVSKMAIRGSSTANLRSDQVYDIVISFASGQTMDNPVEGSNTPKFTMLKAGLNGFISDFLGSGTTGNRVGATYWDIEHYGWSTLSAHPTPVNALINTAASRGPTKFGQWLRNPANRAAAWFATAGMTGPLSGFFMKGGANYDGLTDASAGFLAAANVINKSSANPSAAKVLVLITDGPSNFGKDGLEGIPGGQKKKKDAWSIAQRLLGLNPEAFKYKNGQKNSDALALQYCKMLKQGNLTIYTILIGESSVSPYSPWYADVVKNNLYDVVFNDLSPNTAYSGWNLTDKKNYKLSYNQAENMLSECATDGVEGTTVGVINSGNISTAFRKNQGRYYFSAKNEADLQKVLNQISKQIKNIRIVQ